MNFWTIKEINEFFDFLGAPKEWIGRGFVILFGACGGLIAYIFTKLFILPRMFENMEATIIQVELVTTILVGVGLIGSYFIGIYLWKSVLSKVITWKI